MQHSTKPTTLVDGMYLPKPRTALNETYKEQQRVIKASQPFLTGYWEPTTLSNPLKQLPVRRRGSCCPLLGLHG